MTAFHLKEQQREKEDISHLGGPDWQSRVYNDFLRPPRRLMREVGRMVSTVQWCGNSPRERSSEVTFPCSRTSREVVSDRVSQKRIFLSKWPLIIVVPEPSVVTRSLQLEPANLVSIPENKDTYINKILKVNLLSCSGMNNVTSVI